MSLPSASWPTTSFHGGKCQTGVCIAQERLIQIIFILDFKEIAGIALSKTMLCFPRICILKCVGYEGEW